MRYFSLILAFIAMLCVANIAQPYPLTVSANDHPRLIFSYNDIDDIRDNVNDSNHPFHDLFVDLKADAQDDLDDSKFSGYYMPKYLLADLLWQGSQNYDSRFYDVIENFVQDQIDNSVPFVGEGSGALRLDIAALFYDWCYDSIPTTMRRELADLFVQYNYGHVYNYTKYWIWDENHNKYWHYLGAIVNDYSTYGDSDQYTNADIVGQLGNYVDHLDQHLFPCWDFFSQGGIDGYGGLRAASQMTVTQFFHDFTNYDPIAESAYINKMPGFWKARLRPDGGWSRMPAKYNISNMGPYYFPWFSKFLGDEESQWVANEFINVGEIGGYTDGAAFFAWYDDSLDEDPMDVKSPSQLEWYDSTLGFFLGRSDYDLFNTDQTITVGFFNGPDTQGHRSQNHMFVAKGDRNLLLDYNQYAADWADNWSYFTDTMAHNSVMIWRPGTDPEDTTYHCDAQPGDRYWFGGQLDSDEDLGEEMYPLCNGFYGYRGEITAYDKDAYFTYIEGNATPVYHDRADSVKRQFLWLKPGVIFIQDYIDRNNAGSYTQDTIWAGMFHTIEKPVINGTIAGVTAGTVNGGDMYSTDTDTITVTLEDAIAKVYYLAGDFPRVRLIGGPNSEGKYYQQNHNVDGDSLTSSQYDSYRTDSDISFEFYSPFDGKNHVPIKCNGISQYDFDHRNRSSNTSIDSYYNANSAGQWTFMMQKKPGTTLGPLVCNTLIYVPQDGEDDDLSFTENIVNGISVVEVTYQGQSFTVTLDPAGFTYQPNFSVLGACCFPLGNTCQMYSETACGAAGGTYVGDGIGCDPNPCSQLQPDPEPCEPDTVYIEVPVSSSEKDTLNLELKLQIVVPKGTEITPQ